MREHDYTRRLWGHSFIWDTVIDKGQQLKGYGFGITVREGDHFLLADPKDRTHISRYQVTELRRPANPADMFFATVTFAPRVAPVPDKEMHEKQNSESESIGYGPGLPP